MPRPAADLNAAEHLDAGAVELTPPPRRGLAAKNADVAILVAAAAIFAGLGRGRWVVASLDPQVWLSDAESMLRGGKLLRDVRDHYGPLGMAFLTATFRMFGPTVATALIVQFVVGLAAVVAVQIFARSFLTSTMRIISALGRAIFIIWMPGEGNLLFPYAFAISPGLLLVVLSLAVFLRALRHGSVSAAILGGVGAGLTFLFKQELGGAAAAGMIGVSVSFGERAARRRAIFLLVAGTAAVAAVAAGLELFVHGEPFLAAMRKNQLWPFTPISPLWRRLFWRMEGLDHPGRVLRDVGDAVIRLGVPAGAVAMVCRRKERFRWRLLVGWVAAGSALCWVRWTEGARFVPLALALPVVIVAAVVGWRAREPALAGSALAAIPLLYRVGFRGLPDTAYAGMGYVLVIPIAVLFLAKGTSWMTNRSPVGTPAVGVAGIVLLGAIGVSRVGLLRGEWRPRTAFRTSRGTVYLEPPWRQTLPEVADRVRSRTSRQDEVLFLPNPMMLDFLLDRRNCSLYANLIPGMLPRAQDEDELIKFWESSPPKIVVIFERTMGFFPGGDFGEGYARKAISWIDAHYRVDARIAPAGGVVARIYVPRDEIAAKASGSATAETPGLPR